MAEPIENRIQAIQGQIYALIKDDKDPKNKHKWYKEAVEHCEEMSWHVYGTKPEELLMRMRPREDPAIRQYRLESYEPITKSYCKKALSIVHKIFNPKLYSIRFHDDKQEKYQEQRDLLKDYSMKEYPRFNSVVNYFANYVLKKTIADPNGVILCQPYKYGISATERVQPYLTVYKSCDVHHLSDDYALLFDDKIETDRGQIWEYTYADLIGIYKLRITKLTNQNAPSCEIYAQYEHNFNELPVWHLGGEYSEKQDGLLTSFFFDAVPFWNEAINDHSDVNGNYRMHINSQKWEVTEECEYVEDGQYPCDGGYIFNSSEGKKYKCPQCHGSGHKRAASGPYSVYQIDRGKAFGNEDQQLPLPPFGYVAPPVEGLKMMEEKVNKSLEKGLSAINMDVVNKIGENQSGISKEIDRSELNDFLQRIADQFFEIHLVNTFYYFVKYMFGVEISNPEELKKIEPEISKPTTFNVWGAAELTEQLKAAKEASVTPSYLAAKQLQIQQIEFNTNEEMKEYLNLQTILDPLPGVSRDDISIMLANKTVTQEAVIIHDNLAVFVRRAMIEFSEGENDFDDMDWSDQIEVLTKYAQEIIESNKITIDTAAIEGGNGAIDTPIYVEAEAKANLKGSVGGVQGILDTQRAVASGETQYSAALALLYEIYGFDDATARRILGDENAIKKSTVNDPAAPQQ